MGLTVRGTESQFFYGFFVSIGYREALQKAGTAVNISFLSDEACREGWFTGTMIGICCQDLTGFGRYADFDWLCVRNYKDDSAK